ARRRCWSWPTPSLSCRSASGPPSSCATCACPAGPWSRSGRSWGVRNGRRGECCGGGWGEIARWCPRGREGGRTPPAPDAPDARLEEAVAEYFRAEDRGEPLDPGEWLAKYPDLADELASFLHGQDAVKTVTEAPLAGSRFTLGSRIGEYELLDVIGIGGMSIV